MGDSLTDNEIKSIMNTSLAGNEDHLLIYYRMDRIGSSFLDDYRIDSPSPKIAELKDMDPSNSWKVNTDKIYSLEPSKISVLGQSYVRVVQTRLESENKSVYRSHRL